MSKYYKQNNVHIIECTPEEFSIVLKNNRKKNLTEKTYVNANFFAGYYENKEYFTLPVAHLVCDFDSNNQYVKKYCKERGKFNGDKFCFDSGSFSYMNQFYGKAVSTFVVKNGKPQVIDLIHADLTYDYAVSGVPIIRNGQDVKFYTYVVGQGWDATTLYATKHIFLGLKPNSDAIYIMGWKSSKSNMIYSAEAYKKFSAMGFSEVIKLDGGGSYMMKYDGTTIDSTTENRVDNAYIIIKESVKTQGDNPYSKPTRTLQKNNSGNDVKWIQTQLKSAGYSIDIDGSFGPTTQKYFQEYAVNKLEKE